MRRGRGGRSSAEAPRPEKRADPEGLYPTPSTFDPTSPFLLSELQLRYVTQFINVLKSPATREAPFLFIFQRGVTEIPPSLLIDGLWDASDEGLLIDHLGDLARALLPPEQAARLVVTLQSLAVEFAAAPAANDPRYFFPLNPVNVLLGANLPATNGAPATHLVWMSGNDDGSLAGVQPRRTMRVTLAPNSSMTDRVTMSLFLLVRASRLEGAQVLADAMRDWPGAPNARRFLCWQVLWNMFRDMQSGFGMLPPSESLKMLPMTGNITDAFRSIELNLPKWMAIVATPDDTSMKDILADVNRAQMAVVDMAARGAIHRFSWTRSVAFERAVVLAMRDGKYASLLHIFADQRGTLWMATTQNARSAIGHLLVDSRPAQFDDHLRLRVSSALPEAHAIEFTVEEHRVKIMIVHGGTVPLPLEQIAFPDDAMSDATQMEMSAPAAAPPPHVHSPVQAHAFASGSAVAMAPPPLPLPISPQHPPAAAFAPPPPSVAPLPLNGHSHHAHEALSPSPAPTPRARKRVEQKEWEQELRNAMEGVPLAVMPSEGGWWRSMRSLMLRFASEHGKLIWFHRDSAASQTWRQEDPASNKPAGAPDATLRSWWEWHQLTAKKGNIRELRDVYYLVDIEVRADDLDKLHRALPLMQCLDDDTCLYSLNHYIVKVLGNTISTHFDLRPRLSFAPGFQPGVVSTPLHIEGLGHLTSYQWLLGFNTAGVTLLDIYSPDDKAKLQEVCGPGACAAGEWWSAPYSLAHQSQASVRSGCDLNAKLAASGIRPWRQVELKAQQFVMIPAGHPCAAKKWPSAADPTQPIVTLEGHLTWLGFNTISASSNLERMRSVEKTYQRQFLYPELGMLCALMLQPETAEEAQLQHEHMLAAAPLLRDILDKEQRCLQAVGQPTAVPMDEDARLQAWSCSSCSVVLINGHMFCTVNGTGLRRAFCLDCWAEAHRKGYGLLDAKKNQLPLEQHSAQVIHMKGSKRLRDDASLGDDGFSYANDDDGANDGEADFGGYDDDEDEDGPVNDAAAHSAGWEERHSHRLMFRFGPPRDVLAALEDACSAVRAVGSRPVRPAKGAQSPTAAAAAAAAASPRGRKAVQAVQAAAAPSSPVPQPHSPASASVSAFSQPSAPDENALVPQLELMVAQRRADFDHALCRQLREYEQDLVGQLQAADADAGAGAERPKRKRGALLELGDALEHVLRLENDLSRYCHDSLGPADCILCEKDLDAYLLSVWGKMPKACTQAHSCQPCGHKASWQKPLYRCPRDHTKVRSDTAYRFHLECSKAYQGVPVPFQVPVLCSDCLAEMAKERVVQPHVLVRQHIWEQTKATEELFKAGFEIIDIDADGLCLFTVLMHLVRGEEAKQASGDEVLKWLMGRPYELLVAHTTAHDSPAAEQAAIRAELALWPSRTREQWRKEWYSPAFDSICGLLPALLERAGLFKQTYLRYAYDSITGRGRWYISESGAYPPDTALPQNLKFAAIRYGTPVEHYALLEKRPGF